MIIKHLTDNIQDMLTTFLGRDVFLNLIGEKHNTNLIVVLNGAEGDGGSNLRYHITFHLLLGTEIERTTDIDQQHHCQLTLFLKYLHIWTMKTGGHIPVDITHIITKLIFAHLAEGHTPTLKGRMILACEDV